MWIQVRSMDGKKTVRLDNLSKLTPIEDVRSKLVDLFDTPIDQQKLFYRGKVLIDGHKLFDYDVNRNDIIQILIMPPKTACPANSNTSVSDDEQKTTTGSNSESKSDNEDTNKQKTESDSLSDKENIQPESETSSQEDLHMGYTPQDPPLESTYKIGDIIDARDTETGAWFEAELKTITPEPAEETANEPITDPPAGSGRVFELPAMYPSDDGYLYHVVFEGHEEDEIHKVRVKDVRPRARKVIPADKLQVGDRVICCYNMDNPRERGLWYDATITHRRVTKTIKDIIATVFLGKDLIAVDDCQIMYWWDLMALEQPGSQLNKLINPDSSSPAKRASKPECEHCKDKAGKKCKHCACRVCGGKDKPDQQILCDECEGAYHLWCLKPPLEQLPTEEEWFCPQCKNDSSEIVQSGERLKDSKKKSKMASAKGDCNRDWGKGMACVGRTKVCTIVPSNHFGPIPGVEVGTMWKFRVQVSESGVHRPHVAGIHGREDEGAYSIVLSGGYEDDIDKGDEFYYTGSGGRDLSGNKRTAEQSSDQQLTRMNKALAKNCAAPLDSKKGGEAKNWKDGKPVRVVRNCKASKHSKYAPEEGNRYDGIYKIVKYWPERGKSGFLVWRYLLHRDDPTPAPWTKEGEKRIERLGLTLQYPEGYLEAQAAKENSKGEEEGEGGRKRKMSTSDEEEDDEKPAKKKRKSRKSEVKESAESPAKKKVNFTLEPEVKKAIKADTMNKAVWDDTCSHTKDGCQAFMSKVEETFNCICCQDVVYMPVTTECKHNVCKPCLQRSFKAEVYVCPACRYDLGKGYKMAVNEKLRSALNLLYPGYETGR